MSRDDVECWQAEQTTRTIRPTLRYFRRLQTRTVRRGFVPDDPLMRDVTEAFNGLQWLWMELRGMTSSSPWLQSVHPLVR